MSSPLISTFFRGATITSLLTVVVVATAVYLIGSAFYNLYLSPLSKYPGPKLWAISQIPFSIAWTTGQSHKKILDLHLKYGEIIRVSPNQLSFGYPEAWDDVMGHRKHGQQENGKDPDFWHGEDMFTLVGSNRERHGRLRKILSHGFSAQAMVNQQPIFQQYASLLVDRLHKACSNGQSVEMTSYYNWTLFDMAGDLIFGEPFGCLNEERYHPWVKLIFMHIKGIAISTAVIRFPFSDLLIKMMTPKKVARDIQTHHEFTVAQVAKRMAFPNHRPDFMESMIRAHEENRVSKQELHANAHNLIVGGSETTATTLAGVTYLLATNRDKLQRMYEELRATFQSEDEINLISVNKLTYMFAVLHEGLRVYPAVPTNIPRKTPPEGIQIGKEFIPGNTIIGVWNWPMFHNPHYFKDPEEFIPERWTGDPRYESDKGHACQPFSVGPRNCIGKNLAYAEMRLVMAKLVWNFDFELDPRSQDWIEQNKVYLLWEKPQLFIRLRPRTHDAPV